MQSQLICLLQQYRHIFLVETAQNQCAAHIHHAAEEFHVFQQDVAVDVGHHHVEDTAHVVQYTAVSEEYLHVIYAIQYGIVLGILHAPFVDVVAHHILGAELRGGESQNARTRSAV